MRPLWPGIEPASSSLQRNNLAAEWWVLTEDDYEHYTFDVTYVAHFFKT